MGQDTTTTLLIISVLGTARVYVVLLAGFLASKWPRREALLNKDACRCISRICAQLFLPALVISSTGATLSPAALRDSWQLVVAGGLTIALSVFLSGLLGRLLLRPEDRRAFRPVQLAVAFQNCLGFPLLLMESLCEQEDINRDFGDDATGCFNQATGLLFTYFVVWQACFYGWGFYAIGDDRTLELKLTTSQPVIPTPSIEDGHATPSSDPSHFVSQTEGSATVDDTFRTVGNGAPAAIDVPVENVTVPVGDRAFHGVTNVEFEMTSTAPISVQASTHGTNGTDTSQSGGDGEHGTSGSQMEAGAVAATPRVNGGTPVPTATEAAQGDIFRVLKRLTSGLRRSERLIRSARVASIVVEDGSPASDDNSVFAKVQRRVSVVLMSPNIISVMVGLFIAMIFELQQQLFGNPQAVLRPLGAAIETLGTPTVAVTTLVMAGSLVQTSTVAAGVTLEGVAGGAQWNMRRFRFIASALHILCRLILVPAAGFAIFWVVTTYSTVLGENRLMHLIMLIELGMPSAALVIVSLNQLEMPKTAGFMARLYLSQYGVSMFTITLWTALAVHMVY